MKVDQDYYESDEKYKILYPRDTYITQCTSCQQPICKGSCPVMIPQKKEPSAARKRFNKLNELRPKIERVLFEFINSKKYPYSTIPELVDFGGESIKDINITKNIVIGVVSRSKKIFTFDSVDRCGKIVSCRSACKLTGVTTDTESTPIINPIFWRKPLTKKVYKTCTNNGIVTLKLCHDINAVQLRMLNNDLKRLSKLGVTEKIAQKQYMWNLPVGFLFSDYPFVNSLEDF